MITCDLSVDRAVMSVSDDYMWTLCRQSSNSTWSRFPRGRRGTETAPLMSHNKRAHGMQWLEWTCFKSSQMKTFSKDEPYQQPFKTNHWCLCSTTGAQHFSNDEVIGAPWPSHIPEGENSLCVEHGSFDTHTHTHAYSINLHTHTLTHTHTPIWIL